VFYKAVGVPAFKAWKVVTLCALSRIRGADKAADGRVCFQGSVAKRHPPLKATIFVTCTHNLITAAPAKQTGRRQIAPVPTYVEQNGLALAAYRHF
jgi:hypothetical protein